MIYKNIIPAIFIKRDNRFIATCLVNGSYEKVYVPNTGRCKELLINGVPIYLQLSNDSNRKTKYTLISVYKDDILINIDSQVPNKVIFEGLRDNTLDFGFNINFIKPEKTFNNSRFDFYIEGDSNKGFIEVKGVTLEKNGIAYFPDAPTLRGLKHIRKLIELKKDNYFAAIIFLIQLDGIKLFRPNYLMQRDFALALKDAFSNGVKILCYDSKVTHDGIFLKDRINFDLEEFYEF